MMRKEEYTMKILESKETLPSEYWLREWIDKVKEMEV